MSSIIQPTRRGLLTGLVSLLAAPAIVRASSLMSISVQRSEFDWMEVSPYDFNIEKMTVIANSRALKAEYTLEIADSMQIFYTGPLEEILAAKAV